MNAKCWQSMLPVQNDLALIDDVLITDMAGKYRSQNAPVAKAKLNRLCAAAWI